MKWMVTFIALLNETTSSDEPSQPACAEWEGLFFSGTDLLLSSATNRINFPIQRWAQRRNSNLQGRLLLRENSSLCVRNRNSATVPSCDVKNAHRRHGGSS